jgi:SAM-dependent methyltransferase
MARNKAPEKPTPSAGRVDYAVLYDVHADYAARRTLGSFEQEQINIEVADFKLPNLVNLLPPGWLPGSVLEIGCATGELIAAFPVAIGGLRVGVDISAENLLAARQRFPSVTFVDGNFTELRHPQFACVILSDVLEHVEDDVSFLRSAAAMGRYTLVNLPLEDNWLNRGRAYGPHDLSGHLRKYSLRQGLELFSHAGLTVLSYRRVWIHETDVDTKRRQLRVRHFGQAYSGRAGTRFLKRALVSACGSLQSLGRRMFASNLFAIATRDGGS